MQDIVYFDLETKKSFSAVGGSKHKDQMGMSVGVTYSTKTEKYHIYDEEHVDDLVNQLIEADLVVGYNHIHFDYPVLQGYTIYDLQSQTVNLDMLTDLEEIVGRRLKLDSYAKATLNCGKSANGLDALIWWKEYKKTKDETFMNKIAEYCCYDVKVTKCLHEYGVENKLVKYEDKSDVTVDVQVNW